jgi:hypothetical protein
VSSGITPRPALKGDSPFFLSCILGAPKLIGHNKIYDPSKTTKFSMNYERQSAGQGNCRLNRIVFMEEL